MFLDHMDGPCSPVVKRLLILITLAYALRTLERLLKKFAIGVL